MIEPNTFFLIFSAIFLIAFFGNLFFKKTRFSDISILLIIGFLIGSVFNLITNSQLEILKSMSSLFGSLALIIILFEGGLHLNFYKVLREIGKATMFTIAVFFFTVLFSGVLLHYIFSIPAIYALLIGSAIGGVSSAVVIPLVMNSKSKEETKTLITLESAITDVLCIIVFITLFEIIVTQKSSVQFVTQNIISAFAIATVIGAVSGIVWTKVLRDFNVIRKFNYLLTLSFLFLIYVLIEYAKGNGSFGVLIFGLVLGNSNEILKIFKMKTLSLDNVVSLNEVYKFQAEISLFIKAFFFIYLGLIIDFSSVTLNIILISAVLIFVSIASRYLSIYVFSGDKTIKQDTRYILSLHARGLAAAVLGTYPIAMGLVNSYTLILLPITFLVIFLTNITTTFMFFFTERNKLKEESLNEESSQKDSSQEEETNPYSLIKKSNKNKDSKEKIDAN
jgi:cell volume regulation protein A